MTRVILALTATLLASPAWAHAFLETSTPAVGSTVSAAPTQVTITFTEGVEPAFSKLVVQDASGASVNAGPIHRVGTDTYQLAAPLKKVGAGTYKVIWHAVSVDTHKTSGTFTFTVTQ